MKSIIVGCENAHKRLDKALIELLEEDYSRSFIQKLILEQKVLVNSKVVKGGYKLREGDRIDLMEIESKVLDIEKEDIYIDIVYEDKDIIVVNKPQGMIVHPAPNVYKGTLVNALMYHVKDLSTINGVYRPGIVHRIDKDTSGLLVVAKNDFAHNFLSEQFKVHSIRREYVALVHGVVKNNRGRIEKSIGRHPKDRIKMSVCLDGKKAITDYVVLRRYRNTSLVLCKLYTGRTHQIRVHLNSIYHPIVGDPVYGVKDDRIFKEGQLLHARVIGFIHPQTQKYMEFKSELPKKFRNIISNL